MLSQLHPLKMEPQLLQSRAMTSSRLGISPPSRGQVTLLREHRLHQQLAERPHPSFTPARTVAAQQDPNHPLSIQTRTPYKQVPQLHEPSPLLLSERPQPPAPQGRPMYWVQRRHKNLELRNWAVGMLLTSKQPRRRQRKKQNG